jgi:hypothetical protein
LYESRNAYLRQSWRGKNNEKLIQHGICAAHGALYGLLIWLGIVYVNPASKG